MENERDRRPERRQYVRYQYPRAQRPMVEIAGKTFPVLDISERGLGIEPPLSMGFLNGETVDMTIRFAGGDELVRSGEVIHMRGSHVGILLSEAIPQEMIRASKHIRDSNPRCRFPSLRIKVTPTPLLSLQSLLSRYALSLWPSRSSCSL